MPAAAAPRKALSETAREREFYKYAECYTADAESGSHLLSRTYFSPQGVAESSHDTSLTAFAQLGALRLNAKRCIISLFDRTRQFIIAEATQTLSLQSDLVHDEGDALWLGTAVLPKESGICKLVVDMPMDAPCPDDPHSRGVVVVPDLAADERFADMSFVAKSPFTRFYAGVPICSPRGAHIGSYCIMDDVPRDSLAPEHCQFMKDMAITVMAHLQLARAREEHRRGERLVRGLGSFVEGKSTLRNWRGGATVADRSYEPDRQACGGEGQLNVQQQNLQKAQDEIVVSLDRSRGGSGSVTTDKAAFQSVSTRSTATRSRSEEPPLSALDPSPYHTPLSSPSHSPSPDRLQGSPRHVRDLSPQPSVDLQESMLSLNVKQTFSRAANIIRESMEVEGAIFLDASIGSFGGMVSDSSSASETSDSPQTSSSGEIDGETEKPSEGKMSSILGFSTSDNSSINGDVNTERLPIPEKFLKGLLRRHPKGKIYYFDQNGCISSDSSGEDSSKRTGRSGFDWANKQHSDTSSAKQRKKARRFSKFTEAETLIQIFPRARCIALIPLWDNHRERWFSGGIVWTNTPKRVFTTEGELSYLSVFSSSIMSEVARLDASMSDKSKTDLLGSISHELRSPLHGILGSIEMLEDSAVTAFQGNMVHTIETCGRTLLDTIDHLLDFTKINHFMEVSKRSRKHGSHNNSQAAPRSKIGSDMMSLSASVHLDVITEEVVAAVSAGFDTQKKAKANSNRQKNNAKRSTADTFLGAHDASYSSDRYGDNKADLREHKLGGVIVILDIDKHVDWVFNTPAGAWRRIVMNLFANSLKYTEHGYIRISLKAKPLSTRHGVSRSKIVLTVSDSGKGMSKDYLRGRLFQPFAQEDRLAPGTGLGLSIIRQIIVSQGGKIDVQSVQGEGTEVTVVIPLTRPEPESKVSSQFDPSYLSIVQEKTKNLSACLIGVGDGSETMKAKIPSKLFHDVHDGPQALRTSLQEMCRDWFGLQLDTKRKGQSDLYLVVETPFNTEELISGKLLAEIPHITPGQSESLQPIVIVLCRSAASAHALSLPSQQADFQGRIVEYISQPCGPRKLAKALAVCFERRISHEASLQPQSPGLDTARTLLLEDDITKQFGFPSTPSVATDGTGYYTDSSNDRTTAPSPLETLISEASLHPQRPPSVERTTSDDTVSSLQDSKRPGPFLIVDDNHINVKILAAFMKKNHYRYQAAEDGAMAFEVYKDNPEACGIVFMDISMPVMDGLTSTRLIRSYEKLHKLKPATIILLTGLASASVQQEANASGADLFLTKPVRLKDLGKILTDLGQ